MSQLSLPPSPIARRMPGAPLRVDSKGSPPPPVPLSLSLSFCCLVRKISIREACVLRWRHGCLLCAFGLALMKNLLCAPHHRSPFSCLLYRTQEVVDSLDGIVTNVFVDEKGVGGLLIFGLTVRSQEGAPDVSRRDCCTASCPAHASHM